MASINLPFPTLESTGDEKHDMEVYVENLINYYRLNNWFDVSKETEEDR